MLDHVPICKNKYLMMSVPGSWTGRPQVLCEDGRWRAVFDVGFKPYRFKGDEIVFASSLPCDPEYADFAEIIFDYPHPGHVRVIPSKQKRETE